MDQVQRAEHNVTTRRAVDHEGEVVESFVTRIRDKNAALKFLRKCLSLFARKSGEAKLRRANLLLQCQITSKSQYH